MDNSDRPVRGFGRARSRIVARPGMTPPPPSLPSVLTPVSSAISSGRSDPSTSSDSPTTPPTTLDQMSMDDTVGAHGFPRGAGGQRGIPTGMARPVRHSNDYVVSKKADVKKQGSKGRVMDMEANYFRLKSTPSWSLHQYWVHFEPEEDRTAVRKKLFRKAMEDRNAQIAYMFDGMQLFCAKRLEDAGIPLVMSVKLDKPTDPEMTMTIKYVHMLDSGSPVYNQLYNILVRKCLFGMELQEMGRNFFDPKAAITIAHHKLQLWPGFVTSMRPHEHDVLLCVEVTHKVIRTGSVLDVIRDIERNNRGGDEAVKKAIIADLKDTVVMTTYNNKTYHVDDIDFKMTPKSTFKVKVKSKSASGEVKTEEKDVSFAEYYKNRYGLQVTDLNQPLIISRPSRKDLHRGLKDQGDEKAILVPELCQSTGLTDGMRSNFNLMRDLAKYLHQPPKEKVSQILRFMERLKSNDKLRQEFSNWGLEFEDKLVSLNGRVLGNEKIVFANSRIQDVDQKGDFTMAFRSQKMLSTVNLDSWVMLVPQKEQQNVQNLIQTMSKVANPLNMKITGPKEIISLPGIAPHAYLKALKEAIQKYRDLQMFFVILPNNKLELYSQVKKSLAVDNGIPSQCFLAKNVTNKGLMSIATKVVVQMNAKLGGEPWTVKLPLKNTMFIGFDVYKGAVGNKKGTIGAMVATFSPNFAKYFSTTSIYQDTEEMGRNMRTDIKKCLAAYREENNGAFPEMIFMYRDGVGEGQLKQIYDVELEQIKAELRDTYSKINQTPPSLTYITVSKKINTRLFELRNRSLENPPPGSIVDDVVTLPERYDFYLISCAARQGTVSPCSYNVLCDESGLDADRIQLITYKMCHMYFNWSGTIAVPAPCQYAHKLAFLTGMAYNGHASEKLSKLLHFL